ncbi:MAG: hypothetical protein Q9217_003889 [Psora testacea]
METPYGIPLVTINMLKKPAVLLPPYANPHSLYCPYSKRPNSPLHSSHSTQHYNPHRCRKDQRRSYAGIHSDTAPLDPAPDIFWPALPHPSSIPTPYQIFQLKRNAPYTKQRYYQLVKVYHPDRNGHEECSAHISSLSGAVKMERYRLIVAAHEILSDPTKRKAYDKTGAGWHGRPGHDAIRSYWSPREETKWSGFDHNDSPFRNATWEDWERWYQRQSGKKQNPVFASNGGFLSLVVSVVLLGVFGQSLRVDEYGNMFKRQVERMNDDASTFVRQKKTETQGFGNRDARLQSFLKTRDPHGYGLNDTREEQFKKLLPEPETCMSEGIQQQGQNNDREVKS